MTNVAYFIALVLGTILIGLGIYLILKNKKIQRIEFVILILFISGFLFIGSSFFSSVTVNKDGVELVLKEQNKKIKNIELKNSTGEFNNNIKIVELQKSLNKLSESKSATAQTEPNNIPSIDSLKYLIGTANLEQFKKEIAKVDTEFLNSKYDAYGNLLIVFPIMEGKPDFLKVILEKGAKPTAKDQWNNDAFVYATTTFQDRPNHDEIMELLNKYK
jgi:hypothetical protein